MDPFSSDAQDDAEQQHLLMLSRQLVDPSPMQPANHDHLANTDKQSTTTSTTNSTTANQTATTNSTTTAGDIQPSTPSIPSKSITNSLQPPSTPGTFAQSSITFPATPGTPMTPMGGSSTDPGIVPQLQNIVSTVNLGCKLDLKKIALHARNAEYNPKRFAAVIMRIREPRTTALIFSSGKMVCTGAKSEEQSRLAARKYARIVQKLGFDVSLLTFSLVYLFFLYLSNRKIYNYLFSYISFKGKIFRF